MSVYIALFHGRNSPDEDLEDWGFEGPIIGPVELGFTYGNVRLFAPGFKSGFMFAPVERHTIGSDKSSALPVVVDLIFYDGKYYGDFIVFPEGDTGKLRHAMERGREIHDYATFERKVS